MPALNTPDDVLIEFLRNRQTDDKRLYEAARACYESSPEFIENGEQDFDELHREDRARWSHSAHCAVVAYFHPHGASYWRPTGLTPAL